MAEVLNFALGSGVSDLIHPRFASDVSEAGLRKPRHWLDDFAALLCGHRMQVAFLPESRKTVTHVMPTGSAKVRGDCAMRAEISSIRRSWSRAPSGVSQRLFISRGSASRS